MDDPVVFIRVQETILNPNRAKEFGLRGFDFGFGIHRPC